MKRRYWCPSCGCVRDFWFKPLTDCRHNVPDSATKPRAWEPIQPSHPLAKTLTVAHPSSKEMR